MRIAKKPKVKICCISSAQEAELAIRHGADAVGLVSHMPSGPGVIPEGLIAEIAASLPPNISSFLLTSETESGAIIAQQRRTNVTTLQIVDRVSEKVYEALRRELPGIELVQVIHVSGSESGAEGLRVAPYVDAILLDSGNAALPVKELGGTGRVHNWEISREICETVDCPIFLAGGLKPENVREAIRQVAPYGLDLCSGVRSYGQLDESKLAAFFQSVEGSAKYE